MSELQELDSLTGREIAVIGLAGRFPAARNLKEYWRNLRGGIESVVLPTGFLKLCTQRTYSDAKNCKRSLYFQPLTDIARRS
jgi:hypothetical protein